MNSQISFYRRPVLGALLMLLSASAVFAQVNNVRFKGATNGRGTGIVEGGAGRATETGAGTASHIGSFTYTGKATVDLATGLSSGVFQLVAANGDVLNALFVGRGGETETPTVGHIVELMVITGGTGRFQGATGSFTFDRLNDGTTLPAFASTYGSLTGTISTPASTQ